MAKKVIYNKIYGCPKHGNKHGEVVMLKSKENGVEIKKPCFRCDVCKIAYLEPSSGPIGSTKQSVNYNGKPIEIWNTIGPVKLPERVFLYDKKTSSKLCSCKGSIKEKTKSTTHFLLPDGATFPSAGTKVCKTCKKAFITSGMHKSLKNIFEQYNVEVIDEKDVKEDANILTNVPDKVSTEKRFNVEWESAVFDVDEEEEEIFSIKELKPAGKVASAYYDAKIRYNPYQYLPWLKMYVNGSSKLLISDEVGLGKTIEAGILIMEELTENVNGRIVILCPAFLREKWYHEIKDKFLIEAQVYDGKIVIDSSTSVVILPISRIKQYLEKGGRTNFDMVIVDEVHYFKNASSRRYSQLKKLLEEIADAKYVFMSATPINNSGNDYRSIERLFGCNPDRTNITKKQAYISLPERHIEDIYVELTAEEQNFYDATDILDPFSGTIYRHIGASCLYALSKYAFAGEEKSSETKEELRAAIELLLDGMESVEEADYFETIKAMSLPEVDSKIEALKHIVEKYEAGTKIVIFSHYIETVKYLHSVLSEKCNVGYVYANNISNNIPCKHAKNKFEDAKEWFVKSDGKTTILICSDSCREGIDLDVANVLINYDLPFNPSILEQRIGRIDRMSQKNNMEIYNFHVNNTYDDRLHFILNTKLRFINFYADYGIGNPLNITADGNSVLNSFIRYFGQQFQGSKNHTLMSNDDFYVASKLLRKIGIKVEKTDDLNALRMQAILLDRLKDNQEEIVKWFDEGELKQITDEQLYKQRDDLDKILGFPPKIQRRIVLDNVVIERVVIKANENVQFRRRIAPLIKGYADKIVQMEITGNPMHIEVSDFDEEYVFGVSDEDKFIQSSVIEVMRKEGAQVYEIN